MSTEAIHVVDFLKANPEFLVDNPGVLACVELPARTTGKKVSYLQDRQLLSMREKVKTLERRIANLTIAAVENQAIVQKLMALTQVLLPITDETQLTHTLLGHLRTQFAIPMVGLQLWSASADNDNEQDKDKQSIERMKDLYCGFAEHAPSLSVFQAEPQQPRSVVIIPLRFAGQTNTSGVLGFGSADKDRFAPTLEVDFLRTLSEIVCAALSRLQKTNS